MTERAVTAYFRDRGDADLDVGGSVGEIED
jgi:hypothetical protein